MINYFLLIKYPQLSGSSVTSSHAALAARVVVIVRVHNVMLSIRLSTSATG